MSINSSINRRIGSLLLALFLGSGLGCSASSHISFNDQNKNWETFWLTFSTIAKNKDRKAMRALMSDKFEYTFGDGPASPEAAFKHWEDTQFDAWLALQQVISRGAVDFVPPHQWKMTGKVKIAPPEAAQTGYIQPRAIFEESPEGHWRWVAFLDGD